MAKKGELTGRHVLFMVIAFFGVMMVVNFIFVRAALKTFPGVAEDKSYAQGLRYNETLAEREAQLALGWQAEITGISRDGERGIIVLQMMHDASPLSDLSVSGVLKRPAQDNDDQALTFKAAGEGVYEAYIPVFAQGVWDLTARAENPSGEGIDFEARIIAP